MTVLGSLARRPQNAVQATAWGDWAGDQQQGRKVGLSNAWQLLTVYGCTRFIADGIATLPVDVLRRRSDGSPEEVRTPAWLERPSPDLEFVAWCTQVLSSLLLAGNAYCWQRYIEGRLVNLIPLDPSTVDVFRRDGRKWYRINGDEIDPFNILHIPGVMFPGSDVGLSPVEAARQIIGMGMSMEDFGARFFDQGSTLSGVIEVPGELAPEKARDMARSWSKAHSGTRKSHLPGVLQGGATWKQMGVTNEQGQFLESRKFTASQIASEMFLIDPSEMGLPVEGSSLTYANLEQRNARKVQVTFLPWIVRLERALTALLPRPQYVKFNVNGLLRGDMKTRFDSYAVGITNGFMTPNEARGFEDWESLPEGGTTDGP